ncbi:hypothetical protein AHAS_Ahas01G0011300 [Arachis hypogaea]
MQRISLSSIIHCVQNGDEKNSIAPICKCGVYIILYKSTTSINPNRLFFGCPFFKVR